MSRRAAFALALAALAPVAAAVPATPAAADHPSLLRVFDCPADEFAATRTGPPPSWLGAMPPPVPTGVTRTNVSIRSADGTLLSARIYRPTAFSGPLPTVLWMTPYSSALPFYGKEAENVGAANHWDCYIPFFLERGYAFVWADMRGTHNSGGCADFGGPAERADGHAVVQWIAAQPWSNGRVGMRGFSWEGQMQYAAAAAAPPALKAIIPTSATGWYENFHPGGTVAELALIQPVTLGAIGPPPSAPRTAPSYPMRFPCQAEPMRRALVDGTKSAWWRERDLDVLARRIRAAVFHPVGLPLDNSGWWGRWMVALQARGVPHRGLIGPWEHGYPTIPYYPYHELRWFEHWLKDHDTGVMAEPRYTFVDTAGTGVRTSNDFPGPSRVPLEAGAGRLAQNAAPGRRSFTSIPFVQRPAVWALDELHASYAGDPVTDPLRISGPPVLEIVASTNRDDANFAAHLFDVGPDGSARWLTRGYLDARHRVSLESTNPVVPHAVERYTVRLDTIEHVLVPGHRLELRISSVDSCLVTGELTRDPIVRPVCDQNGGMFGIVSDLVAGRVTLYEGPGLTRLVLPTAPA